MGGTGINEPVFEICSIISRGTISAAGCLDLHKYAHGSDNERRAEAVETSSVRFTDEFPFVRMIESVYSLCGKEIEDGSTYFFPQLLPTTYI